MDYPGTQYAQQRPLDIITELPEIMFNGALIKTTAFSTPNNHQPSPKSRKVIFWTNDTPNLEMITTTDKMCNSNLPPGTEEQYTYNCILTKLCYYLPPSTSLENFNFNFESKPIYSVVPYDFNHQVIFFGQVKHLFNMYISLFLVEKLEGILVTWGNSLGVQLVRNTLPGSLGPSQLITPFTGTSSRSIKIQLCVQDNNFYWAIETLLRNYTELTELGMSCFKFVYLRGESKLFSISEIFPDIIPNEPIETYRNNGKEYRRELLNPPNIVIYIREDVTLRGSILRPLVSKLTELFPDDHNVSVGVPRFNIRLNKNIFFSTGGGNEFKYGATDTFLPTEYDILIKTPELHATHAIFSKYLTGHDIIEDGRINNISSYNNIFSEKTSFKDQFERFGLLDFYNDIFRKLGIAPFDTSVTRRARLVVPTLSASVVRSLAAEPEPLLVAESTSLPVAGPVVRKRLEVPTLNHAGMSKRKSKKKRRKTKRINRIYLKHT